MFQQFLIAITFVLLSVTSILAQSKPKAWRVEEVQEILKQRVDIDKQCVGIAVGVIGPQGNQMIGYGALRTGRTSSKSSAKPDANTVFEIGSVTKVFTTLLLADMVQRGEVSLSDPASKYLPKTVELPTRDGREITLLDLGTHTSALPPIPNNFAPKDDLNPYADYSVEEMYTALSTYQLTRDIGKEYEYSNLGMGLLGHILALRAGMEYEQLVAERITKPLGMTDTSITLTENMQGRLAFGHNEVLEEVKNWDLPTLAGAGALRSTVADMLKFVEANMGKSKSPLSDAMALQTKTRIATGTSDLSIGLGWHILKSTNAEIVWHNGETGGYHSFVGFDKKRGVGVVVLANTTSDIDDIGLHLLDRDIPLRKFEPIKERTAIKLAPEILESYVGDYEILPTFVISIARAGDQLSLQATGQPKFELFAESESEFFLKVIDAQISFVKDDTGKVTKLVLHQNGAHQPGKKLAR
jgi:serine-type D-Ala-D-Ala carboxypeptidase/endopeptidase